MVSNNNILKPIIIIVFSIGSSLATEDWSDTNPELPSQALWKEVETLKPSLKIESFFKDKKAPANMHERKLARESCNIARAMLGNAKGVRALPYVGYGLYLGCPDAIEIIYNIGFRKNCYQGFNDQIMKEIQEKFLEACKDCGASEISLDFLCLTYEKKWEENEKHIKQLEAIQEELERSQRWWTPYGTMIYLQNFLKPYENIKYSKMPEELINSSKKSLSKRNKVCGDKSSENKKEK